MGQRRHHIGQDITDASWLEVITWGGDRILCRYSWYSFFKPLDAVDKVDLQLAHDQFDGVKILLAGEAPGKVMSAID